MTPEAHLFILKANQHLHNAKIMFGAGLIADAGRTAYLAGFHAVQGFLFDTTGKTFKTHHGVQVEFRRLTKEDARFTLDHRSFLSDTYTLKSIADYMTGEDAQVTAAEAERALDAAERLVAHVTALLGQASPGV